MPDPCPICGGKMMRVRLGPNEWWECENSVLEFFDGMWYDDPTHEPMYKGPTHDVKKGDNEDRDRGSVQDGF